MSEAISIAFLTAVVFCADLWQQLVDWVWRKWGQQVDPDHPLREGWFAFGTLDTGDLIGKRYWHFFTLALPVYGSHYSLEWDDYRWSRLRISWWKGRFRHRWEEVLT